MATKAGKKRAATSSTKVVKPKTAVQEALEVTWVLKGHLKNVQISYLRVGALLTRVKTKNLFGALGHPTIDDYADKRLSLGRTSLYKYIQVYEWVSANHPEWLEQKPKGFIPDLSDAANLIRIEQDLATSTLTPNMRATLQELRDKGLKGQLKQDDVERAYRATRSPRPQDSIASFASKLRALRKRGLRISNLPAEAISHLDAAIDVLSHTQSLARVTLPALTAGRPVRLSS